MSLPSPEIVRAAARWLGLMRRGNSVPSAWAVIVSDASHALTVSQYTIALEWLTGSGVLDADGYLAARYAPGGVERHLLAETLLAEGSAPWLGAAVDILPTVDDLPSNVLEVGLALGLSGSETLGVVRAVSGKVNAEQRAALGALGEELLVDYLRSEGKVEVDHVSLLSDAFGYDISARRGTTELHIEVKTSRDRSQATIYLSRNEYQTMLIDPDWCLVVVIVAGDGALSDIRLVSSPMLTRAMPVDTVPGARWESAKLRMPVNGLTVGIPALDICSPSTAGAQAITSAQAPSSSPEPC